MLKKTSYTFVPEDIKNVPSSKGFISKDRETAQMSISKKMDTVQYIPMTQFCTSVKMNE